MQRGSHLLIARAGEARCELGATATSMHGGRHHPACGRRSNTFAWPCQMAVREGSATHEAGDVDRTEPTALLIDRVRSMTDWQTISSLAVAGGTLVLAVATFSAVRSANRSANVAEEGYLTGLRPLLVHSLAEDHVQKVGWSDRHFAQLGGGQAIVEEQDGVIYLALGLRNAGAGIALLHGWYPMPDRAFVTESHASRPRLPSTHDRPLHPTGWCRLLGRGGSQSRRSRPTRPRRARWPSVVRSRSTSCTATNKVVNTPSAGSPFSPMTKKAGSVAASSIGTWTVRISASSHRAVHIATTWECAVRPGGVEPPNLQIKSPLLYR